MLGIYRTLLALMVVTQHLGGIRLIGVYAVFSFYLLSGYLMTYIIQQNYGHTPTGLMKYALNRFLRIYPLYWLSILLSLLITVLIGQEAVRHFHGHMYLPTSIPEVLKNILIFFPYREAPRLTPPAWALTVELFYYAAIGLGLSRTRTLTWIWFGASIAYHIIITLLDMNWNWRYFNIAAASLPFSTGALIYHYREEIAHQVNRLRAPQVLLALLLASMFLNWATTFRKTDQSELDFYLNYAINALIVCTLLALQAAGTFKRLAKLDKKIGDFSYPIYLIHFQAGLITLYLAQFFFGKTLTSTSVPLLISTLPLLILLSWLLTVAVERPIEAVRTRIKNSPGKIV